MALTETGPLDLAATLSAVEGALWSSDLSKAMRLSDDAVTAGAAHPTLLGLAGLKHVYAGDNQGALPLLLRAREHGDVVKSPEVSTFVLLLGGTFTIMMFGGSSMKWE